MRLDPSDLSPLYFRGAISSSNQGDREEWDDSSSLSCAPYLHPALIVALSPLHGRGLMLTQDVAPGTCLFVIWPAIKADVNAVYDKCRHLLMQPYESVESGNSRSCLESAAEQVLLEAIRLELEAKSPKARSVLSLVASSQHPQENSWISKLLSTSVDLLTARDSPVTRQAVNAEPWLSLDPDSVSDALLLKIVRHNAFGPDFVSYERLQHQFVGDGFNDSNNDTSYRPYRLLGMYPLAAMINHSCASNAVRSYAGEAMVVHASQPIRAGTEVLWSYASPIDPDRRAALHLQHGFACACEQCSVQQRAEQASDLELVDASARRLLGKYNRRGLSVEALSPSERDELVELVAAVETALSGSPTTMSAGRDPLTNSEKRYLRLGWMHMYLNYLNLVGRDAKALPPSSNPHLSRHNHPDLLALLMQLHLAFCASHNASTEHLSVLHFAYEMAGMENLQHGDDQTTIGSSRSTNKLRVFQFWTRQLQIAHAVRYGPLGNRADAVKACLQHTMAVLRRRDGYETARYWFL